MAREIIDSVEKLEAELDRVRAAAQGVRHLHPGAGG